MNYKMKEVSEMLNIPASAIRYYDQEGLIPALDRDETGARCFNENNVMMLRTVNCLRQTGMKIKDIRRYAELCKGGEETAQARFEMLTAQKQFVEEEIARWQANLEYIQRKCDFYGSCIWGRDGAAETEKEKIL